jgi:Zn-finger nucleic acid-binding protein
MSANCPRCAKPLQDQQLDELSFRCCLDCKGMLILHPALIDVLEKSWHAIPQEKAETTEFRTPEGWQNAPALSCPDCHQTMEKYGYMGIAAIQINRCDPCTLLWLDADELQNMVLALAKTNYRSEAEWEQLQRERVDTAEAGVQAAGIQPHYGRRGWLFAGSPETYVAARALISLLLR